MDWHFVDNPKYAGREPTPLQPACHDGSPSLDIQCTGCENITHIHESQIAGVLVGVGARCAGCGELMVFPPGRLQQGFTEMRNRGWLT